MSTPFLWCAFTFFVLGVLVCFLAMRIVPDWVDEWRERKARRRRAKRVRVVDNAVVRAWERRTRKS